MFEVRHLAGKRGAQEGGMLEMSKSEQYLKEAFAGESQANRKYLAYAEKAKREGHAQAARLFVAAAEAETVHAHNHLRALGGIGDTPANLKDAVAGETHEFKNMYPEMLEAAKQEGNKDAERSFRYALEVEKVHGKLYQEMLDHLGAPGEEFPYFVCPVCGFTSEKRAPGICPVCGTKGDLFKKIE
jgi:rubrerythrin